MYQSDIIDLPFRVIKDSLRITLKVTPVFRFKHAAYTIAECCEKIN